MPTIVTILSCVLIGQLAVAEEQTVAPAEPLQATSTEDDSPSALRKHPPQMVAQAMALPSGSAVTGQPLALMQALSVSTDRRLQLAIAQAYWQTVEAMAKYNYCLAHVDQLGRLPARQEEAVLLQAARAAAMAVLREAELAAGSTQHELAGLVQLPADAPLPLPADQPHVGAYKTNYQELFAQRTAPDRARLIDRILPIRRMAIDQRAVAVQAAQDALTAASDAYQAGQGSMQSVVSSSEQLLRQQRAFIETVCRYNRDIAEYAMIVAPAGAPPQALVAFMIKTPHDPGQPSSATDQGGVQAAGLNQPIPSPANRYDANQPSVAPLQPVPDGSVIPASPPQPRRDPFRAPSKNESTLAPRRDAAPPGEKKEPTSAASRGLVPIDGKNKPTLAPPRSEPKPKTDDQSTPDASENEENENIRYSVGDPFSRRVQTAKKGVVELAAAATPTSSLPKNAQEIPSESDSAPTVPDATGTATALYPALVEAAPAVRETINSRPALGSILARRDRQTSRPGRVPDQAQRRRSLCRSRGFLDRPATGRGISSAGPAERVFRQPDTPCPPAQNRARGSLGHAPFARSGAAPWPIFRIPRLL